MRASLSLLLMAVAHIHASTVDASESTDTTSSADIAMHFTEQQLRENPQRSGELVLLRERRSFLANDVESIDNDDEGDDIGPNDRVVVCATGRYGMPERWRVVLAIPDDSVDAHIRTLTYKREPLAVFASLSRDVRNRNAPCVAARDALERMLLRYSDDSSESTHMYAVRIESEHGDRMLAPAPARVVVRNGLSLHIEPHDQRSSDGGGETNSVAPTAISMNVDDSSVAARIQQTDVDASAFASALDVLNDVAARNSFALLTPQQRASYATEFSNAGTVASDRDATDLDELQRDLLELLLQAERELLVAPPPFSQNTNATSNVLPSPRATWSHAFSLTDWEQLRDATDATERQALATDWTTLAKLELARSGNATAAINCLRRALEWSPGYVPAYLELSTLVAQHVAHNPQASCDVMELLLVRASPSELRAAGTMSQLFTQHFAHCSVVIRMAGLWDTSALFRYAVSASVVVSVLHGIWIACACCRDYAPLLRRVVSCARIRDSSNETVVTTTTIRSSHSSSSRSHHSTGATGSSSSTKKLKHKRE